MLQVNIEYIEVRKYSLNSANPFCWCLFDCIM